MREKEREYKIETNKSFSNDVIECACVSLLLCSLMIIFFVNFHFTSIYNTLQQQQHQQSNLTRRIRLINTLYTQPVAGDFSTYFHFIFIARILTHMYDEMKMRSKHNTIKM